MHVFASKTVILSIWISTFCELIIFTIYFNTHARTHTHTARHTHPSTQAHSLRSTRIALALFFLCVCGQNHTCTSFYGDSQMDCHSVSGPCLLQGSAQPCPQVWNKTRLIWFSSTGTGDASQCQIGIRSSQMYGIKMDQTGTEVQAVIFKLKNKTYKSPSHPLDTKPSSITQIIAVSHDCISQTGGQAVSSHN